MLSARSPIERKFWKEITIESLKQQIRNGVNTPRLSLASIQQWYDQFIDNHVTGTDAQKEALKELPFYETEYHKILPECKFDSVEQEFQAIKSNPNAVNHCGTVPITKIKEEILHLMLLDLEVIHLRAGENAKENFFRYQAPKATEANPVAAPAENMAPQKAMTLGFSPEDLATLNTLLKENPDAIAFLPSAEVKSGTAAALQFSDHPLPATMLPSEPSLPDVATLENTLPKLAPT
jgi:hypothetical protein